MFLRHAPFGLWRPAEDAHRRDRKLRSARQHPQPTRARTRGSDGLRWLGAIRERSLGGVSRQRCDIGHPRPHGGGDGLPPLGVCLGCDDVPAARSEHRNAYCDTCEHNDRQRGDTMSLFRWLKSGRACLLIRTDVLFYVSLVTFHGVSFLPICVHPPTQAGAEPMLLGYVWQTDGRAREIVIKYSSIDSPAWRPVGLLDVVVCGIREGQVCASAERVSECASAHVVGERGSEVSTPPTCHLELCSRAAGLVLPTTRCPPVRGDSPALDRAR